MSQKESYKVSPADYWILLTLVEGGKRFNELCEHFPKATVAKELGILEEYGYVKRIVASSKPPQTTYEISKTGREFVQFKTAEVVKQLEVELVEKLRLMGVVAPDPTMQLITKISKIPVHK